MTRKMEVAIFIKYYWPQGLSFPTSPIPSYLSDSCSLIGCESLTLCFASQMTNPAIQNDFSYYRRTISRMRINNVTVKKKQQ